MKLQEEPKLKDRISRCCICEAIEKDGRLIPRTQYNPKKLEEQGFYFSDTALSKQCAIIFCRNEDLAKSLSFYQELKDSCPK